MKTSPQCMTDHIDCRDKSCTCSHHEDRKLDEARRGVTWSRSLCFCGLHKVGETWGIKPNPAKYTDGKTFADLWAESNRGRVHVGD